VNALRAYRTSRPYLDTLHLLADLPLGVVWGSLVITFVATSAGLAVTLLGIPLLVLTLWATKGIGALERRRARRLLAHEVAAPVPIARRAGFGGVVDAMRDPVAWKAAAYSVALLVWGPIGFSLAVTLVALALGSTAVLWTWALPADSMSWGTTSLTGSDRFVVSVLYSALGVVTVYVLPVAMRAISGVDRWLVTSLLGTSRTDELEQRVEQLTESRDASVSAAAAELARLERDLHDGTQQRLVSLAMELGVARERLAAGAPAERVLPLVDAAHTSSKEAIAELRELVRGVQPAVLTDRGLDAALSGLAARSPVPVTVEVDPSLEVRRPTPAVESTAYFVVAEALTNAAKHARATRVRVDARRRGGDLVVTVDDDGVGGAVSAPTGGLAGMRDRALAVDGQVRVVSPEGGPTTIELVVPCGS
jgi:signal transduction histidine kinase